MIEQGVKTLPKACSRKREKSNTRKKSKLSAKPESSVSKKSTKPQLDFKTSASYSSPAANKNPFYEKCCEDNHRTLKLSEITPKNPERETSEGVEQFIRQVSHYIEKKSPFKDKVMYSFTKTLTPQSMPNKFGDVNTIVEKSPRRESNLKKTTESQLNSPKRSTTPLPSPRKSLLNSKPKVSSPRKDLNEKKSPREVSTAKPSAETKRAIPSPRGHIPFSGSSVTPGVEASKQNSVKNKKPSEIPLRKNRPTRLPKPISTLLRKPVNTNESEASIDNFLKKKPFSPIEELSLCSEVQIAVDEPISIEKFSYPVKESVSDRFRNEKRTSELSICNSSNNNNINELEISSDIPILPDFSNELVDLISCSRKKSNVLDLERVKTSSFTILRDSSTVLNRLESYHLKNVSSKEISFLEKNCIAKSSSKLFPSNQSFSSLKIKSSKKNLSTRASSKGNKPNLKTRVKKLKKENEDSDSSKHQIIEKRKIRNSGSGSSFGKNRTKKVEESNNVTTPPKSSKGVSRKMDSLKKDLKSPTTTKRSSPLDTGRSNKRDKLNLAYYKRAEKSLVDCRISKQSEKSLLDCRIPKQPEKSLIDCKIQKQSEKSLLECRISEQPENVFIENEHINQSEIFSKPFFKEALSLVESEKVIPSTPPPTPVLSQSIMGLDTEDIENEEVDDDSSSTKTVTFDVEVPSWKDFDVGSANKAELEKEPGKFLRNEKPIEIMDEDIHKKSVISEFSLIKNNSEKKLPPAESKPLKIQLKIDFLAQDDSDVDANDENEAETPSFNWLFIKNEKSKEELNASNSHLEKCDTEKTKEDTNKSQIEDYMKEAGDEVNKVEESVNETNIDEYENEKQRVDQCRDLSMSVPRPQRSCSSLKRKIQPKSSTISIKTSRKKKCRSDAGEHRLPCTGFFYTSDVSLQNKTNTDTKQRANLSKPHNREEPKHVLEEAVKLKKSNSEPHTFRGYIWKRTEFASAKGHKLSVSSVTSSLRHLNTDDIDDFVFWEAVPQNLTSCWETSLYHYKKPWTVLSCSVFKDNRESNTPGLILENLRNGGRPSTRRSTITQKDKVNSRTDNLFDVEPSIAQKNIDIRNWLAALNFPTPPSTSNEVSEGNFSLPSPADVPNFSNNQINPKRRRILPVLKYNDGSSTRDSKEKFKTTVAWSTNEAEGLMELMRRKSGGFVIKDQQTETTHLMRTPTPKPQACTVSKSLEEKPTIREKNNRITASDSRVCEKITVSCQIVQTEEKIEQSQEDDLGMQTEVEEIKKPERRMKLSKFLKGELVLSNINIWKYLFIFTLFFIIFHYFRA